MAAQTTESEPREHTIPFPEPTVIPPRSKHTHTLILLHGRGGVGRVFGAEIITTVLSAPSSDNTLPKRFPGLKFIFPSAKTTHLAQWDLYLPQWFDRGPIGSPAKEHNDLLYGGLRESTRYLRTIINSEAELVGAKNVIIGGLSQGCAQALHVLLSYANDEHLPLGGLVGMSGWLPFKEQIADFIPKDQEEQEVGNEESRRARALQAMNFVCQSVLDLPPITAEAATAALSTPIWLAHGNMDKTVTPNLGEAAAQTLEKLGWDVTWMLYDELEHWFAPMELEDMAIFLSTRVDIPESEQ
ncbi:hypothetical protein H112_02616 [Trichophyton rubrum D6]|uniref:Phospholipase/carboxylesterase/thioesterase domain-containing protein n=3 Tax=Trichophyton rubrum TaxID=5551 RepID=A0A178F7H0_TRIRU|nr:uncharacterized protein TERG_06373 [Trichophyton rubrum CBS 118892]EZF24985.1 hypothetical protein H100_02623 [Trichophyton rubrum MR850]EZF43983.1 hypothetical protein H102_02613 [Trichophyton rubrum CBS 100081]EZF54646.1 hypothetical protein H103_02627 [Trichophyton rubrum CBS 288.86]EZF65223.1 hypothetical protein H104_02605 [Trichophyton rubrum CBS 289.86]EZF86544.1 hypothetical protein H110_02622 [Trichophyton rubrum MR1448]EZF97310.1 hypothetical protein H113_02632 [Trichophyton rubr